MDHKQLLTRWLVKEVTNGAYERHLRREGYHYAGMSDVLLQHGVWYAPIPFPAGIKKARARQCFLNAALLAVQQEGYKYVEGYAIPPGDSWPVHHAWNVDAEGNLFDRTWKNGGLAYLGVVFSTKLVCGAADRRPCVFDRVEIFREPWTGESRFTNVGR